MRSEESRVLFQYQLRSLLNDYKTRLLQHIAPDVLHFRDYRNRSIIQKIRRAAPVEGLLVAAIR